MIRFEQVSKVYSGGQLALDQVSFHLEAGEMAFLTGHSGSGKSTVLKLITAIERLSSGQLFVAGKELSRLSPRHIPYLRRSIGIIFQDHNLLMDRSVYHNVALPLVFEGFSEREIAMRVEGALEMVNLADKFAYLPVQLSGGEQQRVGIARAIVHRPALLLADEPTGNLDPKLSADIMRLFEVFNQAGTSVLIASHDLSLISRMSYRTLTLNNGQMQVSEVTA